jgi:hypothetical protein
MGSAVEIKSGILLLANLAKQTMDSRQNHKVWRHNQHRLPIMPNEERIGTAHDGEVLILQNHLDGSCFMDWNSL